MAIVRSYGSIDECQHCGGPLPPTKSTGRTRLYCTPACRKAAYEQRRARKPEATIVKVVDRVVVERHETTTVVDKGHDINRCMLNVAQSPRACANVIAHLAGMARNNELLDSGEWAPVVRALGDLGDALNGDPPRRYR
ncbi:hypothetical protein GCM10028801_01940 [Nocardioides maradonensis]